MANQTIEIVADLDDVFYNGSLYTGILQFGSTAANNWGGLSFVVTSEIPAGSTINSAYVRVFRTASDSGTGAALIGVEDADPTTNTRFSSGHPVQSATTYTQAASTSVNWIDYQNQWVFGSADALPTAITSQIQSLVDAYGGVAVDERINIQISGNSSFYAACEDYSAAGTNHAELFIDWTAGGGAANPKSPLDGIMFAGPLRRVVGF